MIIISPDTYDKIIGKLAYIKRKCKDAKMEESLEFIDVSIDSISDLVDEINDELLNKAVEFVMSDDAPSTSIEKDFDAMVKKHDKGN